MGETEDEGNMHTSASSSTSVILIELSVVLTKINRQKSCKKVKLHSGMQYKPVLVEANENKER